MDKLKELYLGLDSGGKVRYYKEPKKSGTIWSYRRTSDEGYPQPYHRNRKLSNGQILEIFSVFKKDHPSFELLKKVKQYPKQVKKMINWAIEDLIFILDKNYKKIDIITPMPSRSPFAVNFAKILARKMNIVFYPVIEKSTKKGITGVPINIRKTVAKNLFDSSIDPKNLVILIVDDYITTGASLMGAAEKLYDYNAKKVIAVTFAI